MTASFGLSCVIATSVAEAQHADSVPLMRLATPLAKSEQGFSSSITAHGLAAGRILINDARSRRLVVLDSMMKEVRVLADSVSQGTSMFYGRRAGSVIQCSGDLLLFVDPSAMAIVQITPEGEIGRTIAPPQMKGVMAALAMPTVGKAACDNRGRLLFTSLPEKSHVERSPDGGVMMVNPPDTLKLLRADLATRQIDTIASLYSMVERTVLIEATKATLTTRNERIPLRESDVWVALSNGDIAVLRVRDFSIDWVLADGSNRKTPKLPHSWVKLSDEQKRSFLAPMLRNNWPSRPIEEIPDYYPPFNLPPVADSRSQFWIMTTGSVVLDGKPASTFLLVNGKGQLVSRLATDRSIRMLATGRNGDLYFTEPGQQPLTNRVIRVRVAKQ